QSGSSSDNYYPTYGAGFQFIIKPQQHMLANLEYAHGNSDNYGVYLRLGTPGDVGWTSGIPPSGEQGPRRTVMMCHLPPRRRDPHDASKPTPSCSTMEPKASRGVLRVVARLGGRRGRGQPPREDLRARDDGALRPLRSQLGDRGQPG